MPDRATIAELPPSAKLVVKVLEWNGPLTQREIVEESLLSPRTVRDALNRLAAVDAVDEEVYFPDARQSLYVLACHEESEEATAE